jgi:hypothetical protein
MQHMTEMPNAEQTILRTFGTFKILIMSHISQLPNCRIDALIYLYICEIEHQRAKVENCVRQIRQIRQIYIYIAKYTTTHIHKCVFTSVLLFFGKSFGKTGESSANPILRVFL